MKLGPWHTWPQTRILQWGIPNFPEWLQFISGVICVSIPLGATYFGGLNHRFITISDSKDEEI